MRKQDLEYIAKVAGVEIITEPQGGLEIGMKLRRAAAGGWGGWASSRECTIVGFANKKLEIYAYSGRLEWAEGDWGLLLKDRPETANEIVVVYKEDTRDAHFFAALSKVERAIAEEAAIA